MSDVDDIVKPIKRISSQKILEKLELIEKISELLTKPKRVKKPMDKIVMCRRIREAYMLISSINNFENVIEAVEDKHKYNIEGYTAEKRNTQIYYYVKLNPLPTYEKTLRVLKRLLNDEDKFYNTDFYNDIKTLYDTPFKFDEKIQQFYSKQRNRIIYEYDKNVDKKNNTKIKFVNHLGRQMHKVETVIYTILSHIDNNAKFSKLKNKLYSTERRRH